MKKVLLILLSFTMLFTFADEESVTWKKNIDWENNRIEISIKSPLNQSSSTLASSRRKAENWIEDNKTNIFFKNILDIKINSLNSVSEIINTNPEIYYKLDLLAEKMTPDQTVLSTNLAYLDAHYSYPIYPDFVSVFYTGSQHIKKLKKLDHRDYGEFTGLIVYVPESISLHQKSVDGTLTKVLFPRIFDEDMNLILDYTMVEPEFIKRWGMVVYGESFDENIYQSRIGITPLRTIARGLFGKNNSDIIISNEDADMLIGTNNNLNIISQARILILN